MTSIRQYHLCVFIGVLQIVLSTQVEWKINASLGLLLFFFSESPCAPKVVGEREREREKTQASSSPLPPPLWQAGTHYTTHNRLCWKLLQLLLLYPHGWRKKKKKKRKKSTVDLHFLYLVQNLCQCSDFFFWNNCNRTQPATVACETEAPSEYVRVVYTLLLVWVPICVLCRCLVAKFLRRSSVGSLLTMRCWLGWFYFTSILVGLKKGIRKLTMQEEEEEEIFFLTGFF